MCIRLKNIEMAVVWPNTKIIIKSMHLFYDNKNFTKWFYGRVRFWQVTSVQVRWILFLFLFHLHYAFAKQIIHGSFRSEKWLSILAQHATLLINDIEIIHSGNKWMKCTPKSILQRFLHQKCWTKIQSIFVDIYLILFI